MTNIARKIVEDTLSHKFTREIWSGNYEKVLPVTAQDIEISTILPAVFYMFRFGCRRGSGNFFEVFGPSESERKKKLKTATIERMAKILAQTDSIRGVKENAQRAILGDLLLCFCLENIRHNLGRDQQIQRAAPVHYMSSWLDLPKNVGHLRNVPEMIVAMLADQQTKSIEQTSAEKRSWFPVGGSPLQNLLVRAFSQGVFQRGTMRDDLASDQFDESVESIGLDQLLMVRMAQQLKRAPDKSRGKGSGQIPNQHPISEKVSRDFSEDIRRFLRSYSTSIPRHTLVEFLECCIAIGMISILTSAADILIRWADTGSITPKNEQRPSDIFIDCSNGIAPDIKARSEQSMDDLMRRVERFPAILMVARLLDIQANLNKKIIKPSTHPYATDWMNLLGDVLHDRNEQSERIKQNIEDKAENLLETFQENYTNEFTEVERILSNDIVQPNPVIRFAEGLLLLVGPKPYSNFVDSILMTERPNGLAMKRRTKAGGKFRIVRSFILSDAALEYLVHTQLLRTGGKPAVRNMSFGKFIGILRTKYGFHIDTEPRGTAISAELLQENRNILERRLRDLGLLIGVNDAEAMKRLKPRFEPVEEY